MKLIRKITDSDFEKCEINFIDTVTRYSSRGILFNDKKQIAMMYMTNKGYYKLPGGGAENNETIEETFLREILEETGCKAEIIKEVGIIEEHKSKNNFLQISYCYVSKVVSKHQINLTENEISLGFKLCWLNIEDALKIMEESIKFCNNYSTKFMLLRDITIIKTMKDDMNK